MDGAEFYHVAYLVDDIEQATEQFASTCDHHFGHVTHARMRFGWGWEREDTSALTFPVTYSIDGPPHVELIERGGSGVFGNEQPLGFHHAGYWVSDLERFVDGLAARDVGIEATVYTGSGSLLALFARSQAMPGVRLEFVSAVHRAKLERWFRSGAAPA